MTRAIFTSPIPVVASYAAATLVPVILIGAGATYGGVWAWIGFLYMTLFTFAMDQLIALPDADEATPRDLAEADALSAALALVHFALLFAVVGALASGRLGPGTWFALFAGAGLFFGQVSNSNAHELIHRTRRPLFQLGKWVYISLLFGHHTSAHTKVHHRFAASAQDPNSARRNEGFYAFAKRAWWGSFVRGYEAEQSDLARRSGAGGTNPYVLYCAGALGFCFAMLGLFGWAGLGAYILIAWYAQTQLLLSDYVQHYGLRRATRDDGKLEPIGAGHSWNASPWFSRHLMLNAPRHSDHHAHPSRVYPALRNLPDAPVLPSSLPVMAMLALFPKLWRRVMNPRLETWTARSLP
ncbi:alkane 1-monooxygenase [Maritimibacter sp. DP1N21-5]|uniref:alkane 1-monooxygenase n=1 Tax=Maritimibacter sp. DP1N21-5 TaxID=2836867 RepID=UPI001C484EC9|nr:alkane 1-monooxygenase [Maritimibacter sp. DP1N21-5]MBV7410787.1 alkane 1-monooxygenase [Maritimibacter sp. DP1N21-5]